MGNQICVIAYLKIDMKLLSNVVDMNKWGREIEKKKQLRSQKALFIWKMYGNLNKEKVNF